MIEVDWRWRLFLCDYGCNLSTYKQIFLLSASCAFVKSHKGHSHEDVNVSRLLICQGQNLQRSTYLMWPLRGPKEKKEEKQLFFQISGKKRMITLICFVQWIFSKGVAQQVAGILTRIKTMCH